MDIRDRIEMARRAAGFANAPSRFKKYELDGVTPNLISLVEICEAYGTDPSTLLDFREPTPKSDTERLALLMSELDEGQRKAVMFYAQSFRKITLRESRYIDLTGVLWKKREELGMSRRMMAEALRVSPSLISAMENGWCASIPLSLFCRMASLFDMTLEELFCYPVAEGRSEAKP